MNKRVLLAGLLGGVAMFMWSGIAHMALPLGEAGIQQFERDQPLLDQMKAAIPSSGMYMFPGMAKGESQAQYQQKISAGPSGLLIFHPRRDYSFGASMGVEFTTELIEALIAVYLLSRTRIASFAGRLGFIALLGLAGAITTNISYWNWYAFPSTYTAAYAFVEWTGYLCVGLVAAAMRVPRPE